MNSESITVFYKWTAKPGKFGELKTIYAGVLKEMEETEPGTLMMQYYEDEENQALVVHDLFSDLESMGYHLGVTAAAHFNSLLEIATPGPFFFAGDIPEDIKGSIEGMNMGAEFSTRIGGFTRD